MKKLVLATMLFLVPSMAMAQDVRFVYPAIVTTHLMDAHSTRLALARPNTHEANGLWVNCVESNGCVYTLKSAVAAGAILGMEFARKKNPKLAFWTSVGLSAGVGFVAYRNYRVVGR